MYSLFQLLYYSSLIGSLLHFLSLCRSSLSPSTLFSSLLSILMTVSFHFITYLCFCRVFLWNFFLFFLLGHILWLPHCVGLSMFLWVGWNGSLFKPCESGLCVNCLLNSFGRADVVGASACGTWCVTWPKEVGCRVGQPGVCMLPCPFNAGRAAYCGWGFSVFSWHVLLFNYLLS